MSNTPSSETVDEILLNHGGRSITYFERYKKEHHDSLHYNQDREYADAVAKASLRQAIEEMVERVIGEDETYAIRGIGRPDVIRDVFREEQRQRAKEELSKLFGKE